MSSVCNTTNVSKESEHVVSDSDATAAAILAEIPSVGVKRTRKTSEKTSEKLSDAEKRQKIFKETGVLRQNIKGYLYSKIPIDESTTKKREFSRSVSVRNLNGCFVQTTFIIFSVFDDSKKFIGTQCQIQQQIVGQIYQNKEIFDETKFESEIPEDFKDKLEKTSFHKESSVKFYHKDYCVGEIKMCKNKRTCVLFKSEIESLDYLVVSRKDTYIGHRDYYDVAYKSPILNVVPNLYDYTKDERFEFFFSHE